MQIAKGCYPTMITPYKDGVIDYKAVDALVEWYIENGCDGIFAVCQSSEMFFLSLEERIQLAKRVVDRVNGRISVVVGGHISNGIKEQADEINALGQTGADAVVWITNRLDIGCDGDEVWLQNAEKLLPLIDQHIMLGTYECPLPYKRLLTSKIIDWCIQTKRFGFLKDTCCDPVALKARQKQFEGTEMLLYNANQQTLLGTLQDGCAGYCGIMANFVPKSISWLCHNYSHPKAETVANILSMMAFTEGVPYPVTAKRFLNDYSHVAMAPDSRAARKNLMTPYLELMLKQMHQLDATLQAMITE